MSSSDSAVKKAWSHFYQEYGQAMLAWQLVESEFATVFSMLTKIPPAMAIQIFYSARSFRGRIDIYKARPGLLLARPLPRLNPLPGAS